MAGGKVKVNIAGIAIIAALTLLANFLAAPEELMLVYVSSFGFLSLLSILFVLAIPILVRLKQNKFTIGLLLNRRWIGIYTFFFGLIHGVLVLNFFFSWDFARFFGNPGSIYLSMGLVALIILAAMAGTSNDTAVRKMGRNWKRLHNLLYLALLLSVIHAFQIGQIFLSSLEGKAIVGIAAVLIVTGKGWLKFRKKKAIAGERMDAKPSAAEGQAQPPQQ
jgi:sulfoxide reductase heme-binding subunit YedZ